jgi:hypothetical protein
MPVFFVGGNNEIAQEKPGQGPGFSFVPGQL